ncbi:hypothetical protein [Undibacterium sp. Ji49W]|uniref:hypothetical protein n=1 Tax=Undibacterium sp. Ji49W TaxID=3413040 RepID=UPI003BF30227
MITQEPRLYRIAAQKTAEFIRDICIQVAARRLPFAPGHGRAQSPASPSPHSLSLISQLHAQANKSGPAISLYIK